MRHKRGQHLRAVHQRADRPDLGGLPTTPIPVVAGGPAIGWVTGSQSREEAGVPYVDRGEARIWYTEQGTGFAVLTLAPGGMRSSVPMWQMAAVNPLTAYAGQYRMIAMDQRNAGQSAGPLETGGPWAPTRPASSRSWIISASTGSWRPAAAAAARSS
jgi:pimeloyl-ACP methyl ester carboxylesterase